MTDRETWEIIWRALVMVEKGIHMAQKAIAKKNNFGEYSIRGDYDTIEEEQKG